MEQILHLHQDLVTVGSWWS